MKHPIVSFTTTKQDSMLIQRIVDRAFGLSSGVEERLDLEMDIVATHANGCKLDLRKLLNAPDFDFAHDIIGIRRHLDRSTGRLSHHFLPRCAK